MQLDDNGCERKLKIPGAKMKSDRLLVVAACLSLLSGLPSSSFAQLGSASRGTSTGTQSSGMFGGQTIGLQSGSTPGSNTGGFGSGMTTGMSSGAQNSASSGGLGSQGSSLGLGGGMIQNNQGFIGASSQNVSNFFSRQGQAGATQAGRVNFGALTSVMTQARQNQFNQQQAQKAGRNTTQPQGQFRVPLRLGFQPAPISGPRFNVAASRRLNNIPGLSHVGSISASLEGRTAVLRGTVASEADRQLAEGLARLEPEVMAVRNELVVGAPAPVESLPPPPRAPSGQQ